MAYLQKIRDEEDGGLSPEGDDKRQLITINDIKHQDKKERLPSLNVTSADLREKMKHATAMVDLK